MSCGEFSLGAFKFSPIVARPGNIISVDMADKDAIKATKIVNSMTDSGLSLIHISEPTRPY